MKDPTLILAGLSMWIEGRQFPDLHEYWDANWLVALAQVKAPGASVKVHGAFIRVDELKMFRTQLQELYNKLSGEAKLDPMEPDLSLVVTALPRGLIAVEISITPDHLTQSHRFEFEIDQSYLPTTLSQLDAILVEYPVRGSP